MTIAENLKKIEEDIKEYSTNKAKLLVVTKTHGIDKIREVYDLGYRDFGENKVQELEEKIDKFPEDVNWHLIGHLQRNKVKKVVGKVFLIHSVDSARLLKEINQVAKNKNCVQDILLQFNISKEDTKSGFYEEDLGVILEAVKNFQNINIKGVMTMAPNTDDNYYITSIFRKAKKIFDNLSKLSYNNINMEYISMGMTNDYILALKEGANIIRLGSKIFGKRMN